VRLTSLESTVQRLDSELRSVRDWATREFAEIRSELRQVRETVEKDASLRRDVRALETRVDHLERRLPQ
jgi:predicted RNase H-like nuclease (RuvC/YqgF family)